MTDTTTPAPTTFDASVAKSALENWGQHHAWCQKRGAIPDDAGALPPCNCGYEQALASFDAARSFMTKEWCMAVAMDEILDVVMADPHPLLRLGMEFPAFAGVLTVLHFEHAATLATQARTLDALREAATDTANADTRGPLRRTTARVGAGSGARRCARWFRLRLDADRPLSLHLGISRAERKNPLRCAPA
jgi:hypothetical protein